MLKDIRGQVDEYNTLHTNSDNLYSLRDVALGQKTIKIRIILNPNHTISDDGQMFLSKAILICNEKQRTPTIQKVLRIMEEGKILKKISGSDVMERPNLLETKINKEDANNIHVLAKQDAFYRQSFEVYYKADKKEPAPQTRSEQRAGVLFQIIISISSRIEGQFCHVKEHPRMS